ncbi:hypothetical protein C8R44DRAFT_755258 [Mycena epipterygia]|nr:hypothetical protein C8R44DRAFT_755258 [Mycena epipterygia]
MSHSRHVSPILPTFPYPTSQPIPEASLLPPSTSTDGGIQPAVRILVSICSLTFPLFRLICSLAVYSFNLHPNCRCLLRYLPPLLPPPFPPPHTRQRHLNLARVDLRKNPRLWDTYPALSGIRTGKLRMDGRRVCGIRADPKGVRTEIWAVYVSEDAVRRDDVTRWGWGCGSGAGGVTQAPYALIWRSDGAVSSASGHAMARHSLILYGRAELSRLAACGAETSVEIVPARAAVVRGLVRAEMRRVSRVGAIRGAELSRIAHRAGRRSAGVVRGGVLCGDSCGMNRVERDRTSNVLARPSGVAGYKRGAVDVLFGARVRAGGLRIPASWYGVTRCRPESYRARWVFTLKAVVHTCVPRRHVDDERVSVGRRPRMCMRDSWRGPRRAELAVQKTLRWVVVRGSGTPGDVVLFLPGSLALLLQVGVVTRAWEVRKMRRVFLSNLHSGALILEDVSLRFEQWGSHGLRLVWYSPIIEALQMITANTNTLRTPFKLRCFLTELSSDSEL